MLFTNIQATLSIWGLLKLSNPNRSGIIKSFDYASPHPVSIGPRFHELVIFLQFLLEYLYHRHVVGFTDIWMKVSTLLFREWYFQYNCQVENICSKSMFCSKDCTQRCYMVSPKDGCNDAGLLTMQVYFQFRFFSVYYIECINMYYSGIQKFNSCVLW